MRRGELKTRKKVKTERKLKRAREHKKTRTLMLEERGKIRTERCSNISCLIAATSALRIDKGLVRNFFAQERKLQGKLRLMGESCCVFHQAYNDITKISKYSGSSVNVPKIADVGPPRAPQYFFRKKIQDSKSCDTGSYVSNLILLF